MPKKIPAKLVKEKIKSIGNNRRLSLALVLVMVVLLLYLSRGLFLAAMVNNTPITRFSLIRQLEKQAGEQVLNQLIAKALILQEARDKGIKITNEEIDKEIEKIKSSVESQGVSFEDALAFQGQTIDDLREKILIQRTVERILGPNIDITDGDMANYFEENKTYFEEGSTLEDNKEQIKNALYQQKLSEEYQKWISQIKEEANIRYFVNF